MPSAENRVLPKPLQGQEKRFVGFVESALGLDLFEIRDLGFEGRGVAAGEVREGRGLTLLFLFI